MKKRKHKVSGKGPASKPVDSEAGIKPELEQHHSKLTKLDYILAPLVGTIAAFLTFRHVGTAVNWDDLLYMDESMRMTGYTYILNRYGHIYLLKFFFFITRDCITAGRVYWCFVFFGTAILVYWCAKILAGKRGYVVGIIAAVLFLVQPLLVVREWGCPLADFSAMLFVSLGAFVYLVFLDGRHKHRHWVIMALGLIFFWAMKSKETGICMAVLFLGLGEDKSGARSVGRFVRDIGWACLGGLAGCVVFMMLDGVFIGDAFFSVRPSSLIGVLNQNLHRVPDTLGRLGRNREVMSWYAGMAKHQWLVALFGPFMLYLLIGWKSVSREFNVREKMVWLVPLVLLVFLTYIRSHFWVLPRYFSPAIPLVCVWGAQFFWFDVSGTVSAGKSSRTIPRVVAAAGLILLAFLVVYVLMSFAPRLAAYYKFMRWEVLRVRFKTNDNVLYAVGIVPLVVTILLAMSVLVKKRGLTVLFISFTCLFLLVWQPFRFDLSENGMEATAKKSEWRFLPYKVFKDDFQFDKDIKVLISEDVHNRSWMLGNRDFRHCWMFNIFFNQRYGEEHFIHGTWDDVLKGDYTYGIVTWGDWEGVRKKHNVEHLLRDYVTEPDRQTGLLLLKRR